MDETGLIDAHYGPPGLADRVRVAVRDAVGHDGPLDPETLAPIEEFHTGGREATVRMAEMVGVTPGARVLDVGAGVGGPARLLARRFDCRVTALDLTEEFCRLNEELTARTGMSDRVAVVQGDALDMPLPDAAFDVVWTQHAAMNIADRPRLYREMRRVAAPGARLALFDFLAGPVSPPRYPVPWADDPSISFLLTADEQRAAVRHAGFREVAWEEATEEGLAFFRRLLAGAGGPAPPLGLHLVVDGFPAKAANLVLGMEEHRLALARGVFEAV